MGGVGKSCGDSEEASRGEGLRRGKEEASRGKGLRRGEAKHAMSAREEGSVQAHHRHPVNSRVRKQEAVSK
jgi:hypothetical protein